MNKFGIMYGFIQRRIFIGRLNKSNTMFLGKEDVTEEAIAAVGAYIINVIGGSGELKLKNKTLVINAEYKEK